MIMKTTNWLSMACLSGGVIRAFGQLDSQTKKTNFWELHNKAKPAANRKILNMVTHISFM